MEYPRCTYTVCPRSKDPFYVVTYYIKWITTSWTHSTKAFFDDLKVNKEIKLFSRQSRSCYAILNYEIEIFFTKRAILFLI